VDGLQLLCFAGLEFRGAPTAISRYGRVAIHACQVQQHPMFVHFGAKADCVCGKLLFGNAGIAAMGIWIVSAL
jgi:hypothetical protein